MAILKLQNEGDTHTGRIVACGEVAGNFGPQVKFTFEGGDDLFLPKDSADRQLARIPLAYAECVGEMLTFSRDPNSKARSKPYWGIKLATAQEKQQAAQPSKRLTHAEATSGPSIGRMPFDDEGAPPPSDEDNPYHESGPLPPFHKPQPTKATEVAPEAAQKASRARQYLDLLAWVRTQEPTKGMADEAQQAAAATIWIDWKQAGLVK